MAERVALPAQHSSRAAERGKRVCPSHNFQLAFFSSVNVNSDRGHHCDPGSRSEWPCCGVKGGKWNTLLGFFSYWKCRVREQARL